MALINQCILFAPRTVHLVRRCSLCVLCWVYVCEVKGGSAVSQIRGDRKRHRRKCRRGWVQVRQWRLWDVDRGRDDVLGGVIVGLESGERSKTQIWKSSERKIDNGHLCTDVMSVRRSLTQNCHFLSTLYPLPRSLPSLISCILFSIALTTYIYFTYLVVFICLLCTPVTIETPFVQGGRYCSHGIPRA